MNLCEWLIVTTPVYLSISLSSASENVSAILWCSHPSILPMPYPCRLSTRSCFELGDQTLLGFILKLKKKCNFFKHLYIFKFYMYNFLPHEFIHFLKCKKPNVLNQNRTLYELYKLQSPNLRTFLNFEVFGHLSFVQLN